MIPSISEANRGAPRERPPEHWKRDVAKILISKRRIDRRVRDLARDVERSFRGRELVIVALLNGTVLFLADLIRHLNLPLRLDFLGLSSYRGGTRSQEMIYTKDLSVDVRGRNVLVVDDILDTGRTLSRVLIKLKRLNPRQIKTCVLLDKPSRRMLKVKADFIGFRIPNLFVVGYGLDFAERYRNLPFVAVLRPQIYADAVARDSHQTVE